MPLQFLPEQNADTLGLSGKERFTITMPESLNPRQQLTVKVRNQQQPNNMFPLVTCLEAIVMPAMCSYRPVKERPSPSRPCLTARLTLSSFNTEATSDMSLGLSSKKKALLPPSCGGDTWTAAPTTCVTSAPVEKERKTHLSGPLWHLDSIIIAFQNRWENSLWNIFVSSLLMTEHRGRRFYLPEPRQD